jgi:hypothetical protein
MNCHVCQQPMTGRRRKYCGSACSAEARRLQAKAAYDADPERARQRSAEHRRRLTAEQRHEATLRTRTCVCCGTQWRTTRKDANFCSLLCLHYTRTGGAYMCRVRKPKAVRPPKAAPRPQVPRLRRCADCEAEYISPSPDALYCSARCKARAKKRRRIAKQHAAPGTFTWAEVMHLFLLFDKRCAYCRQPVEGQPDPDHVLALSRGGSNSLANILPSCHLCNSDKSNLTLVEWAERRARTGKPPVCTTWFSGDKRYQHLSISSPKAAA